jgi:hypothetical protein
MTPQSVDDRVTTYGSLLRACETAAVLLGGRNSFCSAGMVDAIRPGPSPCTQRATSNSNVRIRRLAFAELRDTTHQYAAPLTFFFSTGSTPWVVSGSHEFAWLSWNGQLA